MRPKIVVLDGHTLNPGDLSWERLQKIGELSIYPRSKPEEVIARSLEADIVLVNKVILSEATINALSNLKQISVTATGYNNVDLEAASARKIPVTNASGYGTFSVAQHVFALILEIYNRVGEHNLEVHQGEWSKQKDFSYTTGPMRELQGKTLGIYGFGAIGQAVARIGMAFGMNILVHTRSPKEKEWPQLSFQSLTDLFVQSDVISLHAALDQMNAGIVNRTLLSQMKEGAILINTARGGLIHEADLVEALHNGPLSSVGLDVLSQEPPPADHPLLGLKNCIITPHNAWASRESRLRLLNIVADNIEGFLEGNWQNVVNEVQP